MKSINKFTERLAKELLEKGYELFNIKYVCLGKDFKSAIESYLFCVNNGLLDKTDTFPIEMVSLLPSKTVGDPQYVAKFKITDDNDRIYVNSIEVNLYHEGLVSPLASISHDVKALGYIPQRDELKKKVDEKWSEIQIRNRKNWMRSQPQMSDRKKGRKM